MVRVRRFQKYDSSLGHPLDVGRGKSPARYTQGRAPRNSAPIERNVPCNGFGALFDVRIAGLAAGKIAGRIAPARLDLLLLPEHAAELEDAYREECYERKDDDRLSKHGATLVSNETTCCSNGKTKLLHYLTSSASSRSER